MPAKEAAKAPKKAAAPKKPTGVKQAAGGKRKGRKAVLDSRVRKAEQGKLVYTIDCSIPCSDGLIEKDTLAKFVDYLTHNLKINHKTGQLGDKVKIAQENDNSVTVTKRQVLFPKRYLKYLTRKFLKREKLRDYIRPVSTKKAEYQLRYFNIHLGDDDEE
eukprot:TRINITY_DN2003_c0_g1_i10.p2 TRINITY_DN2003_c0_g1~~TRINITY_DN2003_c0_g1_i10.p2  ORF type:complete len:160 (+),score=92.69 TRINITY_DN2003_c0_g1_i10:90-569(+)